MDNFDRTGIYAIINKFNGKLYVGSASVSFRRRYRRHLGALKKNESNSIRLQRAFNKYGIVNFKFKIIEIVKDTSIILEREQYWIDYYESYNPDKGYNMRRTAGSFLGMKHSEETKEKIRAQRWSHTEETKELISMKVSKPYKITLEEALEVKKMLIDGYLTRKEIVYNFNNKFSKRMVDRIYHGQHVLSPQLGGGYFQWMEENK